MSENRSGLTGIAIIMVGVVLSSYLLGSSVVKAKANNSEIRVTGSARKDIDSDFIVWTGRVTYRAENMTSGFQSVKTAVTKLVDYLKVKGIKDAELSIGAVTTNALYEQQANGQYDGGSAFRTIKGYDVTQAVTVRSSQVELVEKVSRESTDLIPQGVPLESSNPQFIYTKIGEVKREILGLAAEDARKRAEEIVLKSGGKIGDVRGARMAPLQITPRYDFDIYDSGYNDLSSKEKSITAVVTLTFGVN
ncbi:MAG TPA: SIMPL domain-containing protein [Fimbriimonas sp.]|nr:SIMPL domain-containing protein [Fimbriimonas sp.]